MMSFRRPVNSTTLNLAEVSSLPRVHGHWRRVRGMESVITRQALLRPIHAHNLTILSLAIPEKFKNSKMDHVTLVTSRDGWSSEG